jgi:hypothetical protein
MKKLLSLILLTLATSTLNAQTSTTTITTTPQKWRFGITANLGGSWLKSNRSEMIRGNAGLQYAVNLQIEKRLTNSVSFLTGAGVSWHSGTLDLVNDTNTVVNMEVNNVEFAMVSRKYSFQSVDIPLALKLKTNEIGMITYWAEVGVLPSIRWKASAKDNTYKVGNTESAFTGQDEKMNVNDANFLRASVIGGLGIEYSLSGSTALTAGIQYVGGFLSTLHSESDNLYTNGKIENKLNQNVMSNYVTLNVGILF